jgi:hypothetical protein
MGTIDFGWYLKLNNDLTRANANGARVAAFSGDDTAVRQAVLDASSEFLAISGDGITINRDDVDMTRGTSVEIVSNSVYQSITGFSPVHLLLDGDVIQVTMTTRIE